MTRSNWKTVRLQALQRDNCTCQRCGITLEECNTIMNVHHKIARRHKGSDTLDNLITYCRKCHKMVEPALSLFDGISRMNPDYTNILLKKKTHKRIDQMGHKRESYDEIVTRLLNGCEDLLKLRIRDEKFEDVIAKCIIAYKKVYKQ